VIGRGAESRMLSFTSLSAVNHVCPLLYSFIHPASLMLLSATQLIVSVLDTASNKSIGPDANITRYRRVLPNTQYLKYRYCSNPNYKEKKTVLKYSNLLMARSTKPATNLLFSYVCMTGTAVLTFTVTVYIKLNM